MGAVSQGQTHWRSRKTVGGVLVLRNWTTLHPWHMEKMAQALGSITWTE